jgi:hypothetical protein
VPTLIIAGAKDPATNVAAANSSATASWQSRDHHAAHIANVEVPDAYAAW